MGKISTVVHSHIAHEAFFHEHCIMKLSIRSVFSDCDSLLLRHNNVFSTNESMLCNEPADRTYISMVARLCGSGEN